VLEGGAGNDQFMFTELADSTVAASDRIADFANGDRIDLSAIDAVSGGANNAFGWIGSGAFTGTAGELRAYSQSGSFFVAGDVDGDGVADFTIQTNILMANSDFVL
jgi:serralysin